MATRNFLLISSWLAFFGAATLYAQAPPDLEKNRARERKCLECHDDEVLFGADAEGRLRSVRVHTGRYQKSVHFGKDLTCFDCHPDATDEHHPREGVRTVPCDACHTGDHDDQGRDYRHSAHGRLFAEGVDNAPDCQHCHSAHYTAEKADPASLVHPSNIRATCGACHPQQARLTYAGSAIGGARLSGHGKSDLSNDYSIADCTRCHFGDDTHLAPAAGQEPVCARCHHPDRTSAPQAIGAVHLASDENWGSLFAVARTAGIALVMAALAFAVLPLCRIRMLVRGKGETEKPAQEADDGD